MTHSENNAPDIALVRTLTPIDWDRPDRETTLDKVARMGEAVTEMLNGDDDSPTYVIPVVNDEKIGRTAYYLKRALDEQGQTTHDVSGRELVNEIMESRTNVNASTVRASLARVCELAGSLAGWDDNTRLVLVTSEPFIVGARGIERGAAGLPDDRELIQPGEVVGVHSATFGIS